MYNYKDKPRNIADNNRYLFAKTLSMFEWENLPETIPYRELEKLLQNNGYAFITEVGGELYALSGGLGGLPDVYGNPTEIIVTNQALKFNKTLNLKTDGVLIRSDDSMMGLLPLFNKHSSMLIENDINMTLHGFNSRLQSLISASDDKTKVSAETYLTNLINGDLGVIGESALFDGIKTHNTGGNNSSGSVTQLIEFHQYTKASLLNEIGLGANFNMKRERLTSGEVDQGDDILYPFVDNMMKNRLKAVEQLNEKYDLNLDVDYGSVWAKKNRELVDDIIETSGGEISNESLDESTNEPLHESTDGTIETQLSELSPAQLLPSSDILEAENDNEEIKQIEIELENPDLPDDERTEWVKLLDELKGVK